MIVICGFVRRLSCCNIYIKGVFDGVKQLFLHFCAIQALLAQYFFVILQLEKDAQWLRTEINGILSGFVPCGRCSAYCCVSGWVLPRRRTIHALGCYIKEKSKNKIENGRKSDN